MSELNQNKSFNYSSFSEFCFHKNELPPETRHTVEMLLDIAGTDDYLEAERVLLNEEGLFLNARDITDLSPLTRFKNLTYLNLSENQIYDLTPLQELKKLIDLDLSDNQIQDISPLEALINLTVIHLNFNQIHDISILKSLNNIQELYLDNNQIKDISSLQTLIKLEELTLDDNQISDISSLQNLINLNFLSLSCNNICSLDSIKCLQKLNSLDVSFNKITDFGSFQEFKDINHLHIEGNPISGLVLPTDLTEKYQKLLFVPINHQEAEEAVKLIYINVGLEAPKVIVASNYKSFNYEIDNLLKLKVQIENCNTPSFFVQIGEESWKIRNLLIKANINNYYNKNCQLRQSIVQGLIQREFNNSQFVRQLQSISQITKFYGCQFLLIDNIITQEQIIRQIYLIQTYQSLLKIPLDEKTQKWYDCLNQLFEHCGWFIPFEDVCIVCVKRSSTEGNRPSKFSLDSESRLHAEGEAAIQFADGYGLYYYHGIALPEKYGKVHPNQWQARWLLSENNAELRRILIQTIGYNRICDELQAIQLDSFREYDLIKIDADADVEPIVLLKMICPSTGYTHVLRVPPNMVSARVAITWVNWDVDPEEFAVES